MMGLPVLRGLLKRNLTRCCANLEAVLKNDDAETVKRDRESRRHG